MVILICQARWELANFFGQYPQGMTRNSSTFWFTLRYRKIVQAVSADCRDKAQIQHRSLGSCANCVILWHIFSGSQGLATRGWYGNRAASAAISCQDRTVFAGERAGDSQSKRARKCRLRSSSSHRRFQSGEHTRTSGQNNPNTFEQLHHRWLHSVSRNNCIFRSRPLCRLFHRIAPGKKRKYPQF